MESTFDFLIAFHSINTIPEGGNQPLNSTNALLKEDSRPSGNIIHLCWGIYDLKKKIVIEECDHLIQPPSDSLLTEATLANARLRKEDFAKAIPLKDAI